MSGKEGLAPTLHPMYSARGFQRQGGKMTSLMTPTEREKNTSFTKMPGNFGSQKSHLFKRPSYKFSHPSAWHKAVFPAAPSTSTLVTRMLSVTSEKTIGLMKRTLSSVAEYPHTSLTSSFSLSIRLSVVLNWFWLTCRIKQKV